MAKPYALHLENPPTADAAAFIADVTDMAQGWRRSIRAIGGPWLGSFRLVGDEPTLIKWFNEYLFYTFKERYGGRITWKGVIWEMTLTHRGVSRRRSMADIANAVWAFYLDEAGVVQESSTATQTQSIARYGRMEEIVLMDGYPQAAAEQRRDKVLAELAWPWTRPVGGGAGRESYLDVSVAGVIFTANNKFVTAVDDATGNISVWVSNIVTTDLEFFSIGSIDTNTVQAKRTLTTPERAFDTLRDLVNLGGSSTTPWRLYADTMANGDDVINYEAIVNDPIYYLAGGELRTVDGTNVAVEPWGVVPGVARDLDYPVRGPEVGSWLDDAADIYLEEVVASDRGVSWKSEAYSEADVLAAQQDYALMLLREAEKAEKDV